MIDEYENNNINNENGENGENEANVESGSYSLGKDDVVDGRVEFTQSGSETGANTSANTEANAGVNANTDTGRDANPNANYYGASNAGGYGARPEYEYGYDSRSGSYSYQSAPTDKKQKKEKKHHGGLIAAICICLVLSCGLGGVAGFLAASYAKGGSESGSTDNGQTNVPSASTVVEKYTTTIENMAQNQSSSITAAVAAAHPSVVTINTYYNEENEKVNQYSSAGSGVIWTADGYIVTCNHVIEGANIIKVTLEDGTTYAADVVGTDSKTDVAVLKITPSDGAALTPAVTRGTELVLGETVIAIGNPLGVLGGTVTTGILSALERNITVEGQSMTLLQTDAAINSGNSGGGLFDINGSLIGIVNAKSTGTSVEGIGFAIPISTVKQVADELVANGYVTGRPQLGLSLVTVTSDNYNYIFSAGYYPELEQYATKTKRDSWGFSRKTVVTGVYVIDASSVAKYADGSEEFKYGDKILYVGDTEVTEFADVKSVLSNYSAGDTISVTVLREQSTTIIIKVILGQSGASKN